MKCLQRAQGLTNIYIGLMLGLFPLFWGTDGYNRITEGKFWFFVSVTGVWLLGCAGLLLWGLLRGETYNPQPRAVHWAVMLYLAWGAVSALLSPYGGACLLGCGRYDGYLITVLLALVFFGVSALGQPRRWHLYALALSAALCALVCLAQRTGANLFGLYPDGTNYFDKYIRFSAAFIGTLGNAGITAAFLCLAAPALAVLGLRGREKGDFLFLIAAALSLGALYACDVQAAWVALLGCVALAAVLLPAQRRVRRVAAVVVTALAAAGVIAVYFWPGESGTVWELSRLLHGELREEFGSHRGQIWAACLRLVRERPLLGGGPGTLASRLDIVWSRFIEQTQSETTVYVDNAHNVYLGILVNTGLPSLAAYLAALGCSAARFVKNRRSPLAAALGLGIAGYAIQDFFGLGLVLSSPLLWVTWGLLESRALAPPAGEAVV